jgi:hypothetical protein
VTTGAVLIVVIGGVRLGIPLGDVERLTPETRLSAVPFGHPALAGLMHSDAGDLVPIFDLFRLGATDGRRPPLRVDGATIAILGAARGSVGLRLDRVVGTARSDDCADALDAVRHLRAGLPPAILRALGSSGVPRDADLGVGSAPFLFFSVDAFVDAVRPSAAEGPSHPPRQPTTALGG